MSARLDVDVRIVNASIMSSCAEEPEIQTAVKAEEREIQTAVKAGKGDQRNLTQTYIPTMLRNKKEI